MPNIAVEEKAKKKSCCGASTENAVETYTLVGSYYSLKDGQDTILMFNNKGPEPLVVSPTFFSLNGERLDLPALIIPATSYQEVDLRVLLTNYLPQFEEGSLQVSHQGMRLQLGAQFKILKQGILFDEQFVTPAARFPSSRMESVWWMPSSQSETKFILSNTTDFPVSATIEVDGTAPRQRQPAIIQLNPHETRVLDILRDLVGQQHGGTLHKTGGISITHSGTAGAILARMLISRQNTGYSSVVSFTDPTTPRSSKLNGGGLRLGLIGNDELTPIIVVRNIGSEPTTVRGRISYTNENGEVVFVPIPEVQLAPDKIKTLNIKQAIEAANVPEDITFAGLELEYTTAPGSVIMNAQSVSRSNEQVFQVPLLDPEKMPSSAGGFPWKVDGDYNTIVYIKNETDTPKKYLANLTYEGGAYSLGDKEIKAWQTVALDFKQLRDDQTPDSSGNPIPLNVERGQISWSMVGEDNNTMSGRSEQVNTQLGISSTYACYNCCPHSVYSDGYPTPLSTAVDVGAQQFFGFQVRSMDCYGQEGPAYFTFGYGWLTSDALTATITSGGAATAMNGGTALMTGNFDNVMWTDSSHSCSSQVTPLSGTGEMEVRPTVQITEFEAVGKGGSANIQITVANNRSNSNITLTLTTTSGTGDATFADNTRTMIIRQTRTIEIKGVTESSTKDNIRLRATWGSRNTVLDTETFSILWVTMELRSSGDVSPNNAARQNQIDDIGTDDLGTIFSTGTATTRAWRTCVEIVGTVTPSNFTGTIELPRIIVISRAYIDRTLEPSQNRDNQSDPQNSRYVDFNPQPGGKVYDIDCPALFTNPNVPLDTILRVRTNFKQHAIFQGNRVSDDLEWFSRLSIIKTGTGDALQEDVEFDNKAGAGTTRTSWHLL